MRIIDRYIIREVVLPFVIGLLVFTFILVIPFLIQYAEEFIAKGVPLVVVARIMATLLPQALALAIPAALLVGLLVALGRLSADREFVAMQACGISLMRLLRPVALVSVLGWLATSYVMLVALPDANQTFREITFNIVAARAEGEVKPRVFFNSFPDLSLYVREVPTAGGWNDVFMADSRPGQTPATYLARHGRVVLNSKARTVEMVLTDGWRHAVDSSGKYEVFQFSRLVLTVDPESVFPRKGPQKEDNEMTIAELRTRAAEFEKIGLSTHNQLMAIQRKFSIPVACLVFGLIGLALGATNRRGGNLGSFVFGLGVIFLYYVPLFLGPALAKGHLLAPWLAVWMPNFILGALGCVMMRWRSRAADQPIRVSIPAAVGRWLSSRPHADKPARRQPRAGITPPPRFQLVSTLNRYVAVSYARTFALASVGLAALFYISTFLDLSDKVFKGAATWGMLGLYFWYITPQYVYYVLPMAALLATLVTVGLLTKNSELIVMKACGISLYRIALPMVAGAFVAGAVLFVLEQSILGPANRQAEQIRYVMRGGNLETFDVLNRQWAVGSQGEIYHYNFFNPISHQLLNMTVYDIDPATHSFARRTFMERAVFAGATDSDNAWRAEQGWRREFTSSGDTRAFTQFQESPLTLEPLTYFSIQEPDPKFMSYSQLRGYIEGLRASGVDVSEQQVALERKLSFPFVTLIMTLIAVPFAVTTGRRGAMYGIGVGIVLAISYWVAISVFAALGAGGVMAPLIAAWTPNLLFGSGATYLLLTVRT